MAMNKKGFAMELLAFAVIGFIMILFFVGWMYGSNIVNTTLLNVDTGSNSTNVSYVASQIYTPYNSGMQQLPLISTIILFAYMVAGLVVAYYSRNNPIMLFLYFLVVIVFVIFSVYISNSYQQVAQTSELASTFSQFGMSNVVMNGLPYFVAVIGLFCVGLGYVLYRQENA